MTVVHRVGFATRKDAMDFAKAIWAFQSLNEVQVYCELCFDTNSVELIGLASDIEIEAIPPIDRGAGAKTAQITMRNLGSSTRTFEMRLDWFDRDGASQTGSTVVWKTYTLSPGEVREATFTGGPKAEDYRLSVRAR